MASSSSTQQRSREIILIDSDTDDENAAPRSQQRNPRLPVGVDAFPDPLPPAQVWRGNGRWNLADNDDRRMTLEEYPADPSGYGDVRYGPEIFPPGSRFAGQAGQPHWDDQRPHALPERETSFNYEGCLARVIEMFPNISHDHVRNLYNALDGTRGDQIGQHLPRLDSLSGRARLDNIIEQLISSEGAYPKQEKGNRALKRKREASPMIDNTGKRWNANDRPRPSAEAQIFSVSLLQIEFAQMPEQYIREKINAHHHLYPAYLSLAKSIDDGLAPLTKFPAPEACHDRVYLDNCVKLCCPEQVQELEAARKAVAELRKVRKAEEAKQRAEHENLERAKSNGTLAECSVCFDSIPMNRQIRCDGHPGHFTCFDCALTYIKIEVGESRCHLRCTSDCVASFSQQQLDLLSDKPLLEKLAQLQQEKEILDAGLDDLEECPFCNFKAIVAPIEEDFEFRCGNPDCAIVSCRRCRSVSHVPISCKEFAKTKNINGLHKIEEAMTEALVRSCNQCKRQFIKEEGCNKMCCPNCKNYQCYVCSANVAGYEHFDPGEYSFMPGRANPTTSITSTKCPLYDNVGERHEREVRAAERAMRTRIIEENPDMSEADLEIRVSEAVSHAARMAEQRGQRVPRQHRGIDVPADIDAPLDGAIDRIYAARRWMLNNDARAHGIGRHGRGPDQRPQTVGYPLEALHLFDRLEPLPPMIAPRRRPNRTVMGHRQHGLNRDRLLPPAPRPDLMAAQQQDPQPGHWHGPPVLPVEHPDAVHNFVPNQMQEAPGRYASARISEFHNNEPLMVPQAAIQAHIPKYTNATAAPVAHGEGGSNQYQTQAIENHNMTLDVGDQVLRANFQATQDTPNKRPVTSNATDANINNRYAQPSFFPFHNHPHQHYHQHNAYHPVLPRAAPPHHVMPHHESAAAPQIPPSTTAEKENGAAGGAPTGDQVPRSTACPNRTYLGGYQTPNHKMDISRLIASNAPLRPWAHGLDHHYGMHAMDGQNGYHSQRLVAQVAALNNQQHRSPPINGDNQNVRSMEQPLGQSSQQLTQQNQPSAQL